jgi:hypothetical protein
MRYGSILIVLLLTIAACREQADHTSGSVTPHDSTAARDSAVSSSPMSPPESFEKSLFHEFAHVATAVPKRINDSLLHSSSDPRKIQASLKQYLHRRDSLARFAVAARYGITVDSLDTILARGNAERW